MNEYEYYNKIKQIDELYYGMISKTQPSKVEMIGYHQIRYQRKIKLLTLRFIYGPLIFRCTILLLIVAIVLYIKSYSF
jgi:hypothetical protein